MIDLDDGIEIKDLNSITVGKDNALEIEDKGDGCKIITVTAPNAGEEKK